MKMTFFDFNVASLVPHSPPMLLLDRIISADHESMQSEVTIQPDTLFCRSSVVGAWVGIEYMAQTVAAHAGYLDKLRQQPIKPGFLLGTRQYKCKTDKFTVGMTLRITVCRQYLSDQGLGSYQCAISCFDKELAKATVTVFQPMSENF